ncbi:MAG: alpha/beta fold hydrolase [Carbonactinosporaceae bacterium]
MSDLRTVDVDGVRLAYRMTGDPKAPPMVLLHALGEDGATWDEVTAAFSGSRRVYAPDLRGHGGSDWPGDYSLERMRDDVVAFLDGLDLDGVTLIGHSLGGAVAYLVAEDHPRRVDRLVLEDVAPPLPRVRAVPERPAGPLPFDWGVVLAVHEQLADPLPAWWDRVTEITAPTLIIAGGPDSHIPQHQLADAAGRISDCRLVTIAAGHEVHATRPAEFRTEVAGFLQGPRGCDGS